MHVRDVVWMESHLGLYGAELRQGEVVGVVAHCGDQSKAGVFV